MNYYFTAYYLLLDNNSTIPRPRISIFDTLSHSLNGYHMLYDNRGEYFCPVFHERNLGSITPPNIST
jgi:hypothetical protein